MSSFRLRQNQNLFQNRQPSYTYKIYDEVDDSSYTEIIEMSETIAPSSNQKKSPVNLHRLNIDAIRPISVNSKIKLHGQITGNWNDKQYDKGIIIGRIINEDYDNVHYIRAASTTDPGDDSKTRLLTGFHTESHNFQTLIAQPLNFLYIDSPATTGKVEYRIYLVNTRLGNPANFSLNRAPSDTNNVNYELGVSTFIAQEL